MLWLGGRDDGLWRCDLRLPQKIERIGHSQAGLGFALSDQRVNVIHPGLGQQMWIGTRNGLNLLDSESLQIQQFKSDPGQPQALAGAYITSLLTDQEGRLWIGHGAGINILRPQADKQWRFQHLNSTHGLPDNNVGKFLQDKQGVIWVSTDDGLAKD